ncbi:Metallo-dependent phosphatase-like protein [Cokeromyces recurvatus]|uniref:Metallo-dependent phosphatase-like protein n=1 Tax=Cokeromyces recurvatus TaxID=90255 RepID=UPI0022203546|nr:Metallo-dependent phosphatase-like protein [Cokeromyces recurvatus]KAI7900231.1 Metallo-dependent phosphatase-like protein [Cokeromyces recurvatus]
MARYVTDDNSSVEFVIAAPTYAKTKKQKRLWKIIGGIVAAIVVIVIVIVIAVVVTDTKKQSSKNNNNRGIKEYPISPYSHMTDLVTSNQSSFSQKQRFFVIGDVHGCVNELNTLVAKLNYNPTTDQLILAGDLTSKGPDSIGVIRRAKELGALCVRGNHDDIVIRFKTYEMEKGRNAMYPLDATMPEGNVPDPLKFKNYHTAIALNMTDDDYNYLSSCPVMLHLPFLNNSVVVHAGLDPRISGLENQVPYLVMTMRDIASDDIPTSNSRVGTQWAIEYNEFEKNRTIDSLQVFYGHDAGRGLNIKDMTFGVDTGCVYGGRLTAINIQTKELVDVVCPTYVNRGDKYDD